jgi:hypothetical protein
MAKVSTISKEEYKEVLSQAAVASEILEDERFKFVRDYFNNASGYVEKSILENTIHDVREIVTLSDKLTRLFFTPKQLQVDELCGQYKFIKKFFEDLKQFVQIKDDVEDAIAKGTIKIDDGQV